MCVSGRAKKTKKNTYFHLEGGRFSENTYRSRSLDLIFEDENSHRGRSESGSGSIGVDRKPDRADFQTKIGGFVERDLDKIRGWFQ